MAEIAAGETRAQPRVSMWTVVAASSAGTAFEWYDFFVFGTLTPVIAKNFFSALDETAGLLAALALFGAGFFFRPIGALIFGRVGDPDVISTRFRHLQLAVGSDEQRPPAFEPGRRVLDRREIREQPLELRRLPLDRLGHLARHQPEGDSLPTTSFPAACTWRVSRVNQMPGPPLSCTTLPVRASVP